MKIGILKEIRKGEARVAATPDSLKRLSKKGFQFLVEESAGLLAGFRDADYVALEGCEVGEKNSVLKSDVLFKIHPPIEDEISEMKKGALLVSFLEPFKENSPLEKLAVAEVNAVSMEKIPRTSRAQTMDALSSQAGIAGYRAVIEAAYHYRGFFPMMMTASGSAKPAKVVVLGAGVAGLQAIGTAKRLGAVVEAFDVRPEVKEEIESLGAKFMDLGLEEEGSGQGGYAKELSEEGKKRQQQALTEGLKKFDIIISTANIPGRKAPVLITPEAVQGMREGSVIIDMAAANGGNCPLSKPDEIISCHGVTLVGLTNYPALLPKDASQFYGRNLNALLELFIEKKEDELSLHYNLDDDIVQASLLVLDGKVRLNK